MFEDVIIMGSGHTLIVGHKPKKIEGQSFSDNIFKNAKVSDSLASFGLFGSGMNYNTFYPDLEVEDIVPKDEEFIEPVYRMLSECIVSKYCPTDFSKNNVLKKSMHLLVGQTINGDHETDIGNAIGAVKDVVWQEAYKDGDINIPAGINGLFKIDAKSNPRLARGILMDPPSIHSNSVTVRFLWEPSHPKMDIHEFWNKLGTYDADGELIRRVVTEIVSYMETSLVSNGADPFAKQIRDGKIVLPEIADRNYSFSSDKKSNSETPFFFMDYKDISRMDTIHNTTVFNYEREITQKNNNNMNELELFLASLFGDGKLSLAEGAQPSSESALSAITSMVSEVVQLRADKIQLETDLQLRVDEVEELKKKETPDADIVSLGNETLTSTRALAVENYKKLVGDKEDAAIVSLLNTSSYASLAAMNKGYVLQLEEKFPLACVKCGSHEVSRASSISNKEDITENSAPSTGDAISNLREGKLRSTLGE